ncbi:MAG TPA: hypothetical protein VK035_11540 [Kiloniellales bacterium]|nr:hypothetical protein [Kiloniellales bacterium]
MVGTRHSMEEAVEIQKAFEAEFGHMEGVNGIGICLNRSGDDLALNVFVFGDEDAAKLPETFAGLDVLVDTVGKLRTL